MRRKRLAITTLLLALFTLLAPAPGCARPDRNGVQVVTSGPHSVEVGRTIVLAIPLGIGKPNLLVNALYGLAEADRRLSLRILTGLTLVRPSYKSDLERRFAAPIVERLFGSWPELTYAEALRRGNLAPNVTVHEFFLQAGQWLSNPVMQQNYASLNYRDVHAHVMREGVNVVAQLIAPPRADVARPDGPRFSLSSNTDVSLDLDTYIHDRRQRGEPIAVVGEINANLPYMSGAAAVPRDRFIQQDDTIVSGERPLVIYIIGMRCPRIGHIPGAFARNGQPGLRVHGRFRVEGDPDFIDHKLRVARVRPEVRAVAGRQDDIFVDQGP